MRPTDEPERQREREVKFELPIGAALPTLAGKGTTVRSRPRIGLRSQYWDTADLRLLRRGITLRHRRELSGLGEDRWTLKVPAGVARRGTDRHELSWPDRAGEVPPAAVSLLLGVTRRAELVVVAELSTSRERLELVDDAGRRVAGVDDDVVSFGSQPLRRFREVEVELDHLDGPLAKRVERRMVRAGARPSRQQPKVERVLVDRLDHLATAAALPERRRPMAARLQRAFEDLTQADLGVRADDPHAVHRARVAARRLRADLAVRREELDPTWRRDLLVDLRWLAGALGQERDLDVLARRLDAHRRRGATPRSVWAEIEARLAAERTVVAAQLVSAYASDRYFSILDRLESAAAAGPPAGPRPPTGRRTAERAGVRRALQHYRRCDEQARRDPSDEHLHAARKAAKRLRYVAESAAPLAGGDARRLAERAEAVQSALGRHRDSVVADEWLCAAADAVSPAAAFAAGLAVGAERVEQEAARRQWRRRRRSLRA